MHSATSVLDAVAPRANGAVHPALGLTEERGRERPLQLFADGQERPLPPLSDGHIRRYTVW